MSDSCCQNNNNKKLSKYFSNILSDILYFFSKQKLHFLMKQNNF